MALAPKLELRQGQQLVMTPQLQQAIRLLQLSNVELCTFVEAEVERNPLLERDEAAPEPSPETSPQRAESAGEGDNDWVAGEGPALNGSAREEGEVNGASHANGSEPEASGWASLRPRICQNILYIASQFSLEPTPVMQVLVQSQDFCARAQTSEQRIERRQPVR